MTIPDPQSSAALEQIRRLLIDVYTEEGIEIWLRSRNATLSGEVPLWVIADGRGDEAVRAAELVVGGMG